MLVLLLAYSGFLSGMLYGPCPPTGVIPHGMTQPDHCNI